MTRMDIRSLAEANINNALGLKGIVEVSHASLPFDTALVSEFLGDKKSAQIAATDNGLFLLGWRSSGAISVYPLTGTPTKFYSESEPELDPVFFSK